MKLDVSAFRYITRDEFRVLTAVEMGMRNHEHVPVPLIESIAKITRGGSYKIIMSLLRNKLVAHDCKKYDGYRMTYHGYDFLALRALVLRGTIVSVGRRLGVGKESDVHYCQGPDGRTLAIKLHRLGRISFRNIKEKRDYLQHRTHGSWMYMARLAALKEFAYMKALADEGFPVPVPVDQNRHCVVMSYIDGVPLVNMKSLRTPQVVLERLMRLLVRLARAGIIHGDFNEFNLMIHSDEKVTLIDFPQIIHLKHLNAKDHFDRDVRSTCNFFRKRLGIEVEEFPIFEDVLAEIAAAGDGALANELTVEGMSKEESALMVSAHEDAGLLGGRAEDGGEDGEGVNADSDSDEEADEIDNQAEDKFDPPSRIGAPDARKQDAEEARQVGTDVNLVPAEGREALGEDLGPEAQEAAAADLDPLIEEAAFKTKSRNRPLEGKMDEKKDDVEGDEEAKEEEDSSSDDDEADAPGQVTIASGRKVRRKQSAKEARKNLQKQQKTKPAKPNNAKNKEIRKGKNEVKEYLG